MPNASGVGAGVVWMQGGDACVTLAHRGTLIPVWLDTRHSLTYNERAHKQNIIYGCATAMIYLFSIALNTIEVLKSIKG